MKMGTDRESYEQYDIEKERMLYMDIDSYEKEEITERTYMAVIDGVAEVLKSMMSIDPSFCAFECNRQVVDGKHKGLWKLSLHLILQNIRCPAGSGLKEFYQHFKEIAYENEDARKALFTETKDQNKTNQAFYKGMMFKVDPNVYNKGGLYRVPYSKKSINVKGKRFMDGTPLQYLHTKYAPSFEKNGVDPSELNELTFSYGCATNIARRMDWCGEDEIEMKACYIPNHLLKEKQNKPDKSLKETQKKPVRKEKKAPLDQSIHLIEKLQTLITTKFASGGNGATIKPTDKANRFIVVNNNGFTCAYDRYHKSQYAVFYCYSSIIKFYCFWQPLSKSKGY